MPWYGQQLDRSAVLEPLVHVAMLHAVSTRSINCRCYSPALRLQQRDGAGRSRRTHVVCFQADGETVTGGSKKVKVALKIPYRVSFGQSLCVVGSCDVLGNWTPDKGLPMTWTKDDWWTAELDLTSRDSINLEYKYLVRNSDGGVAHWKPGGNYKIAMPVAQGENKYAGKVVVADAWDESFKKVQVEEVLVEPPADTAASTPPQPKKASAPAAPPRPDKSSAPATPSAQTLPTDAPTLNGTASATTAVQQDAAATKEPQLDPPEFTREQEFRALTSAEKRAFRELEFTLSSHEKIQSGVLDPADPQVLMADRMVAQAKNKAIALSKALQASQPNLELPDEITSGKPFIKGPSSS